MRENDKHLSPSWIGMQVLVEIDSALEQHCVSAPKSALFNEMITYDMVLLFHVMESYRET